MKTIEMLLKRNNVVGKLPVGTFNTLVCLILWTAVSSLASTSSVRTVNLPEMTEFAGRVFYGRCLSVEISSTNGIPVNHYSFLVLEALKGVERDETVTFQQLSRSGPIRIPGIPEYKKGQELLLFLYPDSRLGLTSPVGLGQGFFHPKELTDGQIGFINAYGNRNLSDQLSKVTAEENGLTEPQLSQLRSRDPVSLETMKELVSQLQLFQDSAEAVK